ncbi:hypothetical protein V9T40_006038 [Parthenolecanium corni]|uniref:Uncharacterized protein n=1 Tax=Parthenolecanium corni TaxID=536013 RepID=A0AAN9TTZ9_9HEMI
MQCKCVNLSNLKLNHFDLFFHIHKLPPRSPQGTSDSNEMKEPRGYVVPNSSIRESLNHVNLEEFSLRGIKPLLSVQPPPPPLQPGSSKRPELDSHVLVPEAVIRSNPKLYGESLELGLPNYVLLMAVLTNGSEYFVSIRVPTTKGCVKKVSKLLIPTFRSGDAEIDAERVCNLKMWMDAIFKKL